MVGDGEEGGRRTPGAAPASRLEREHLRELAVAGVEERGDVEGLGRRLARAGRAGPRPAGEVVEERVHVADRGHEAQLLLHLRCRHPRP